MQNSWRFIFKDRIQLIKGVVWLICVGSDISNEQEKQNCVKEASASCSKLSQQEANSLRQGLISTKWEENLHFEANSILICCSRKLLF